MGKVKFFHALNDTWVETHLGDKVEKALGEVSQSTLICQLVFR